MIFTAGPKGPADLLSKGTVLFDNFLENQSLRLRLNSDIIMMFKAVVSFEGRLTDLIFNSRNQVFEIPALSITYRLGRKNMALHVFLLRYSYWEENMENYMFFAITRRCDYALIRRCKENRRKRMYR